MCKKKNKKNKQTNKQTNKEPKTTKTKWINNKHSSAIKNKLLDAGLFFYTVPLYIVS